MRKLFKKVFATFLCVCFLSLNLMAVGTEINVSSTYNTATAVNNSIPNTYNIQTTSTNSSGSVGINAFDRFNVSHGDTVNFNLINNQSKLVNLIYDSSASQIDGIVNSYKNGTIGGNMLFANPNGFIIGADGKFNVGSLTLVTPTEDAMKSIFRAGIFSNDTFNETKLNSLISFSMNGNDYLVNGTQYNEIKINPAGSITIDGTINSGAGIDLVAGHEININSGAILNANQDFTISGSNITHSDKINPGTTSLVDNKRSMAMSDGKNIIIVASNSGTNKDYLSAIVNLSGNVNANKNDVIAASEVYKISDSGTDGAFVYAKSGTDISGKDITLKAQSKITDFDGNLLNLDDDYGSDVPILGDVADILGEVANYIAGYVVHAGTINSKVEVQSGAKLTASDNLNIRSTVDADLNASTTSIGLALNVVDLSSNSESVVKKGAILNAKNLKVSSDNDINLNVETKVSNMSDNYIKNDVGNAVVTVAIEKLKTNAEVENGADLSKVTNNVNVNAITSNTYKEISKNSALPLVDKNHGELGLGIAVNYIDAQNTATLNADTSVLGDVNVTADITEQINKRVSTTATGASGIGEKIGKNLLSSIFSSKTVKPALALATTKSNTDVSKTEIAGALGISIVNASSVAKIGDANNSIKPTVIARNVNVSSTMYDIKSNFDVETMAQKEAKTIAGAIGVNYKDLSSNSTVNADITVNNDYNLTSYSVARDSAKDTTINSGSINLYAWDVTSGGISTILYTKSKEPSAGDILYTNASGTDTFVLSNANYYVESVVAGSIKVNRAAVNVFSDTKITHPLSYLDIINSLMSSAPDFFSQATWSEAWDNVKDKWNSADSADPTTYLNYITALSGLSSLTDTQFIDDLTKTISLASNTNNLGIYDFFTTYVQAASNSVSDTIDSGTLASQKALSGAIGVSAFTQSANSAILDGSSITMKTTRDAGNINVLANSTNEIWTAATLLNPLNYKNYAIGSTSGGIGAGGTVAVSYADSSATATIGNVNITKGTGYNGASDINVIATTDGSFLNISAGSSTGDNRGIAGSIDIGYVEGNTTAGIKSGANIYSSDDVLVKALKDTLNMNVFFALAKSSTSEGSDSTAVGFGISGLIIQDTIDAYINGNVTAKNVSVLADYTEMIINAGLNIAVQTAGKATSQTDSSKAFKKKADESADTDLGFIGALLSEDWDAKTLKTVDDFQAKSAASQSGAATPLGSASGATSKLSSSKAGAGGITVSWLNSDVKAHIGGTINATEDVTLKATNNASLYDTYAALATGGKSGSGASIMLDVLQNKVYSYIDKNAVVNAEKDLSLLSDSDYIVVAASAGISSGKDTTKAGNLAVTIELNDIESYIGEGAKVNESSENVNQTVSVKATNNASTIKVAGAAAVQSGASTQSTKNAAGGTIDADIIENVVKAYIAGTSGDRTTVNAGKGVSVIATNVDKFIGIDVAGAIATGSSSSSFAGILSVGYISDDIEAYISYADINKNQLASSADSTQSLTVKADNNYHEITVEGTGSGGTSKSIGATLRTGIIANKVKSYADNSSLEFLGDSNFTNAETIKQISVAATGSVATGSSGTSAAGVVNGIFSFTDQENYITNSSLTTNKLTMDSDKDMLNIGVTGAISVNTNGAAVGESIYIVGIGHKIKNYIENSDITSTDDITMTTDFNQNYVGVTFGGGVSTAGGVAVSGAYTVLVNNGDVDTHISSDSNDDRKTVKSTNGKVTLKSNTNISDVNVIGQVSVSASSTGVGATILTSVYNSDVKSYIENTNIYAKNGIDVEAKGNENHYDIAAGFSGGKGAAFEGSISTLVFAQNVDAYIKNSDIYTDSGITLIAEDTLKSVPVTGAIGISTGGAGIGGAIFTGVISGNVSALAQNVDVYTYKNDGLTSAIGAFLVKAIQSDEIYGATVAGAGSTSGFAGSGSVTTIVINKNVTAEANDVNNQSSKFSSITVDAEGSTKFGQGTGSISGASSTAVGGAVSTLVINKNINAKITGSNMNTSGDLINKAVANTWIESDLLAGSASGSTSIDGAVATQVLNVDTKAQIKDSTLNVDGSTTNSADSTIWDNMNVVSVALSGSTSLGGAVFTLADDTDTTADIIGSSIYKTTKLDNIANVNSDYIIALVGASASGEIAASGAVSTFVLNSTSNANISDSSTIGTSANRVGAINTKATNDSNVTVGMGQAAASGEVAVGGTVSTLVSNKQAQASIDSSNVYSNGTTTVEAKNIDKDRAITINAGGSGSVALTGTVNTIVLNNTTNAFVSGSTIDTTVANNTDNNSGLSITARDDTTLSGIAGSIAGSDYAAVGAAIFTGVIDNDISAYILNSDVSATNSNITVSAIANETLGATDNPIVVIAAAGAAVGVSGAVNTLVLSSSADSYISGKKTNGITAGKNVTVSSDGATNSFVTAGALGVGGVGVGATVNTFVIGKELTAKIKSGAKVDATNGTTAVKTNSVDKITSYEVAGAAGGTGVAGVVSTNVIQNTLTSAIEDSSTSVNTKDLAVSAKANSTYADTTGSIGVGSVGVGLSVQTNVIASDISSYIKDATVTGSNSIKVNADSTQKLDYIIVSGAVGGTGSGAGAVSTNVVNNNINSYISSTVSNSGDVTIDAKDSTTFDKVVGGVIAVGGAAGVGATVITNVVSSSVNAHAGGTIHSNNLIINASTKQNFDNIYVVGFAGGSVAISGSVLVNAIDTDVKAYTENGSTITANDIDITASADTDIDALVGSASGGLVSVGASVEVNSIKNTVKANTGDYNTITANSLDINSTSNVDIGYSGSKQVVFAGGAGVVAAAGAVVVNTINDGIYAFIGGKGDGSSNSSITTNNDTNVKAAQYTNIYQSIGSATLAGVGIGASIAVNTIKNTINSYIDNHTNIYTDGNILIDAYSKEIVDGRALAASGGAFSLAGGLIYTTIGQNVTSATSDDSTTNSDVNKSINQGNTALSVAQNYQNQSQSRYTSNVNNTYSGKPYSISSKNADAQSTLQTALNNGLNAKVKSNSTSRLSTEYTNGTYATTTASTNTSALNVANITPTSYNKTATDTASRKGATSAFIGSGVTIDKNSAGVKSVTVNAKNEDDIDLNIIGGAAGYVGVGIAAAVANDYTTTEAYINNATNIYSTGNIKVNSTSTDDMDIKSIAATGGIISGSGAVAIANSQKSTKTYINDSTTLSSDAIIDILTDATSTTSATTNAYAIGGGVIGISLSYAYSQGENTVNLGSNVTLDSIGNINLKTNSNMSAEADATALTGSLIGGTGANGVAKAGQNAKITVGSNLSVDSTGAFSALSKAINSSTADTNGRAYGGIAAGVTKTTAEISNNSGDAQTGANIADSSKAIKSNGFGVGSSMINTVKGATKAGSGAAISGSISSVNSNIKANNSSSIGSATINATNGQYAVTASSSNNFESSNNSSAYGAIAATVGKINNNVNSTVKASSSAGITGSSSIAITANNTITKSSTSSNDLTGGAGGIAGIGSAVLTDTISATTNATLAGSKAFSAGNIYATANTKVYDVEKVDVTGYGALAASDGDATINLTSSNIATISNSDVDVDGNAYYSATTDIDIYTKSNVEAYGAMPIADGESNAIAKSINNKVIFSNGANTTTLLDTYISAVTYEDLTAKMYAYSKGLLWNVGSSSADAENRDTNNIVAINNGASVNSYGTVNVNSLDYHDVSASRTAKTVGYAFFGIPITITSHSNADTEDNVYSAIELNGSITSGLGSQRQLTVNKANNSDGYTVSDDSNIKIKGKVTLGTISSSEVTSLVNDLTTDYNNNTTEIASEKKTYTDKIVIYNKTISDNSNALGTAATSANSTVSTAQTYVTDLKTASDTYSLSLDTTTLSTNYSSYSTTLNSTTATETAKLTAIENAHGSATSLANTLTTAANIATQNKTDASTTAMGYLSQRNAYAVGSTNYNHYNDLYNQYNTLATNYATESGTLNTLAAKQASLASSYETVITNYTNAQKAVANASSALATAQIAETDLDNQLSTLTNNYNTQKDYYNSILASGTTTQTYNLLNIDDVIVRSGETNIKGNIKGTGSISAPGNKFTIDVVNNTINDIQYNALKIGTNLKGGIYINGSTSGIAQTIRNPGVPYYNISVANTVDINDPTVKFDAAGNMLFAGDITNPNGSLNILNWTGNVVTRGAITVKDLSISVPNGDYMQGYTNSQFATGGTSGGGDIIAGGDINIMAQTINVNGLIQSGSDIKKVIINDFHVVKYGNNYYQSVGTNNYVQMEQAVTEPSYYYIKGDSTNGIQYNLVLNNGKYYQLKTDGSWYQMALSIDGGKFYWSYGTTVTDQSLINNLAANNTTYSDLNVIKAYYDTSNADGEIELFKANIIGGDITLTGNIVSTGNGKIVLMGGYGQVNITNNTNYKLVTSKLNADNPIYGTLTIRDFVTNPTTDNLYAYYANVQSEIENSTWYKNIYGTKKIANMTTSERTGLDNNLKGYDGGYNIWNYIFDYDGYRSLVSKYLNEYNNQYNTALTADIAANNNIYANIEKAYKTIKTTEERQAFDTLLNKISGTYIAHVDETGALHTECNTSAYTIKSDGNSYTLSNTANRTDDASFSSATKSTQNGLNTTSLNFNPGSDSTYGTTTYSLTLPGYHSWFAWLFGIRHISTSTKSTIAIAQSSTPLLTAGGITPANATSPINITFNGYTTPSINVVSNGDIKIAGNITVSPGDLNITSKAGNIYQDQTAYSLTGKNINLYSNYNIGSESVPIQALIFGGALVAQGYSVANAANIYINAPIIDKMEGYSGFTNVNLKSNNDVVLNASEGNIGADTGIINITGKDVSLKALNGIINLNKDNSNVVASNSIKAQAAGDITLTTQGDMKLSKIYTMNEGNVNLTAVNGNVMAMDTDSTFHVNGNNLTISAVNGYVGGTNKLLTRNTGTFNITAKDDININNVATDTYVGLIESTEGDVSLTSFGAIVDASSGAVPYNIKANNLFLNSQFGGIENISINTDGKLDAYAGYLYDATNGWIIENATANVKINLISKAEPLDTATEAEVNAYNASLKDLTVGTVLAANNVTLNSEGSIYTNDNSSDNITGNKINLLATNGSVGTSSTPLNINSNDALTVYAKDSVYLKSTNSTNALKINEIKGSKSSFKDVSSGETTGYSSLNNVVITADSGILNVADDLNTPNIIAKAITLTVNNPSTAAAAIGIGLATKPLNVYTTIDSTVADNGLTINSNKNVYLTSSANDLLINNLDVTGNVQIQKVVSTVNLIATLIDDTIQNPDEDDYIYTKTTTITNGLMDHALNIKNATITGNLTAKADNVIIGTASISNTLNTESNNLTIKDVTVNVNADLNANNLTTIAKANLNNLYLDSKDLSVTDTLTVDKLTIINLTGSGVIKNIISTANDSIIDIEPIDNLTIDSINAANNVILKAGKMTTIGSADIAGTLLLNSADLNVTGTLGITKTANINIDNDATINNLDAGADANIIAGDTIAITNGNIDGIFTSHSTDFKVSDKLTVNNESNIYATNLIDINNTKITNDLNMESKNINIDEIELLGNMNAKSDTMTVNTSNDLKLGLVEGYSEKYNSDVNITTSKSLLNGNSKTSAINIMSKDVDLTAGVGIGSKTNTVNIKLPTIGGTLKTISNDIINIATTNGPANYSKIITDNLLLNSQKELTINSMDINTGNINTQSYNLRMHNTEIKTLANIYTPNKYVIVKNTDMAPVTDADLQIYITQHPIHLFLDDSNNVSTESVNITRQSKNLLIDNIKDTNSMDAGSIADNKSLIEQNNNKKINEFNGQINKNATLADYVNNSTETQISKIDVVDDFLKNVSNITVSDDGSNATEQTAENQNEQTNEKTISIIKKSETKTGIDELSSKIRGKDKREEFLKRIIKY